MCVLESVWEDELDDGNFIAELCVQNTFIILIMVEKPTSRPMEFCHICRKGKLYTPCGCGCIQGQYFRNEEDKGFSFFFSSLFLLKFGKTNDPLQVSYIFMLVFLGWTSCPLRCLTGFYDLLCQRLCMSSKEHLLCHLALTSLCCLLNELAKTEVQLPHH